MGKKSCTLTVELPIDLQDMIRGVFIGDEGLFNSFSEFGNFAMHWYYENLLLFVFEKNIEIDEEIKRGNIPSGTSKLGMMYRELYLDKDWKYDPARGTKTESVRITGGFAKQIDQFIKNTGFFRSKAEFCLNALGRFETAIEISGALSTSIAGKNKDYLKSGDAMETIGYLRDPCITVEAKSPFTGVCKSDKINWLD